MQPGFVGLGVMGLPVTQLVESYYSEVQAMGGSRWDTASLFARMRASNLKN